MAYPRSQRSRAFKLNKRTSGDVTLNSNGVWASVDTGLDLTLPAQAGDVIEYRPSFLLSNANVVALFDVGTIVSSAIVNRFSGSTNPNGWHGWYSINSTFSTVQGPAHYTLVAGDLSSGTVTLRLLHKMGGATTRLLYASDVGGGYLHVFAQNLGPAAPH